MAKAGNWNESDLGHRCGLDKQPHVIQSKMRKEIAAGLNDQIDAFFAKGGKVEVLRSCFCSTDESFNHPARLHNRTTV
jgi:hypothetical protein